MPLVPVKQNEFCGYQCIQDTHQEIFNFSIYKNGNLGMHIYYTT